MTAQPPTFILRLFNIHFRLLKKYKLRRLPRQPKAIPNYLIMAQLTPPPDDGAVPTVDSHPDDGTNPRNFPIWRKLMTLVPFALMPALAINLSFGALLNAGAEIKSDLHMSDTTFTLGVVGCLLGYVVGTAAPPFNPKLGRRPTILATNTFAVISIVGLASPWGKPGFLYWQFVFGVCGAWSWLNVTGVIDDLFLGAQRGGLTFAFLMILFLYSATGRYVCGLMSTGLGWKEDQKIFITIASSLMGTGSVFLPETHRRD